MLRLHEVGHYAIAVLRGILRYAGDDGRLRKTLHVLGGEQERASNPSIEPVQSEQIGEVQLYIQPPISALCVLLEQPSARCEVHERALSRQRIDGLILAAALERDALRLQQFDLPFRRQHGLQTLHLVHAAV